MQITVKPNRWPNLAKREGYNPPTEMEKEMKLVEDRSALELSDDDLAIVSGGENCTYASQTYSAGSVIKMSDGNNHTCQANGTWN